ncbi:MAG: phosphate ABC transporter permease subunit PstC [Bacteroidales bacterium]|nr:phosphate ABC transporter permease subunit PstC [Bacteroidales bacterium]
MALANNSSFRIFKDKVAKNLMLGLTLFSLALAIIIGVGLYIKSIPILHEHSLWSLLSGDVWRPFKGQFGFLPFIMGTLWVTGISILIALPLCLLTSIYLSEYAHPYVKKLVFPMIDILAGIPPVVYGVWGILVVVPFIADKISPHFVEYSSGYSVLAGGIVLAIMIIPLIISIMVEIFAAIPKDLRDASLSLGATSWQTIKFVLLRKSLPGIIAAVVLAISRAFGETIAVLMVCGNIPESPKSVFDSGYPLPALIANNYGEMMSIPLYDSALMLAALILFVIIFLFNAISRVILNRIEKKFAL